MRRAAWFLAWRSILVLLVSLALILLSHPFHSLFRLLGVSKMLLPDIGRGNRECQA
jgi:hypothetical protein